jgi:hypothetical protein
MSTTHTQIDEHTSVSIETTPFSVTISAITEINASIEAAWHTLSDIASYPSWNPLVTNFDGELVAGNRISVTLALPGKKPHRMKPTLLSVHEGRGFEWLGRIGLPGLFDGRHRFTLEPLDTHRCKLVHHERLSGLLVPMFRSMLTVNTPEGFVALNHALAQQAVGRG